MRRAVAFLMLAALVCVLAIDARPRRASAAPASGGWAKVYDRPAPSFSGVEMFDEVNGVAASGGALYSHHRWWRFLDPIGHR